MSSPRSVRPPTLDEVHHAARFIARILPPTPLAAPVDGTSPVLKLEGLQPTGSFKVRGALAALESLAPDRAVVTASAGNHALGIAYAATRLRRRATVVTSTTAAEAKVAAIRRFAVELIQAGNSFDDAESRALRLGGHEDFHQLGEARIPRRSRRGGAPLPPFQVYGSHNEPVECEHGQGGEAGVQVPLLPVAGAGSGTVPHVRLCPEGLQPGP